MATITKRTTKSGEVRWDASVYVGKDESGRRKSRLKSKTFARKRDAEQWAAKLEVKRRNREPIADASESMAEWMEHWLKLKANAGGKRRIRERTAYDYGRIIERWIKQPPEGCRPIGKVRLDRVNADDLEALYLFMAEQGLSSASIRHVHGLLRQALNDAFRKKKIAWNPALAVMLPKGADEDDDEVPDEDAEHVPSLTAPQARRFLEAARKDRYSALWHLLLDGGLRPSEAFALRWEDVDLDAGTAHVWRSLTRIPNKSGWKLTPLKSDRSARGKRKRRQQRYIPLSQGTAEQPGTVEQLRAWRKQQAKERLALGAEWGNDNDLIFTTPKGTPLHLSNLFAYHFRPVMAEAGLGEWEPAPEKPKGQAGPRKKPRFIPAFRIYDLRHTRGTLGIEGGEDPMVTSAILGHGTVEFTLDTYAHVHRERKQASAAIMERVLFG